MDTEHTSSSRLVDTSRNSGDGDENQVHEQLWYICLGCNRAFDRDFQLRKHRNNHGVQGASNCNAGGKVSALILSKCDLLPKIQVQPCTRYPSMSPSSVPDDTGRLVDNSESEQISGVSTDRVPEKISHQIQIKLMQPLIKLAKLQTVTKHPKNGNRFQSRSANQSRRQSKKPVVHLHLQQESPKYFSSIIVNRDLNVVKTEDAKPAAIQSEVGPSASEITIPHEKVLDEPPAAADSHSDETECLQSNETDRAMNKVDVDFAIDIGEIHLGQSSGCVELDGKATSGQELNYTISEVESKCTEIESLNSDSTNNANAVEVLGQFQNFGEIRSTEASAGQDQDEEVNLEENCKSGTESTASKGQTGVEKRPFKYSLSVHGKRRRRNPHPHDLPLLDDYSQLLLEERYADQRGTRSRPFKCGWLYCGKTFVRRNHLQDHKRRVHQISFPISTGTSCSIKSATSINMKLEENELEDETSGDQREFNKKSAKFPSEPSTEIDGNDEENSYQRIRKPARREAKVRARASISRSVYTQSDSEDEGTGSDNETDMEFKEDTSPSSEEEYVCEDYSEAESIAANDAFKLAMTSSQLLFKLADGEEEMYLECTICYSRYLKPKGMEKHMKNCHSKIRVSDALGNLEKINIDHRNLAKCSRNPETTNPEAIRTCKTCSITMVNVQAMNRHIRECHLNKRRKRGTSREIPDGSSRSRDSHSNSGRVEGVDYGDEIDIELDTNTNTSSFYDDNKVDIDNYESPTETANTELVLTQLSHQVLLRLDDGTEERYLECSICHCRYLDLNGLKRHIRRTHSTAQVNNYLGILEESVTQNIGPSKSLCTETTNPEFTRTCKTCCAIFDSVKNMNRHILGSHFNGHNRSTKLDTEGENCEQISQLVKASNKILLKFDGDQQHNEVYECIICPCKFTPNFNLFKHISRYHSKEEIDKATANLQQAKAHDGDGDAKKYSEVTDPEKIRRCSICSVVLRTMSHMNRHIIRNHLMKGRPKCSICSKTLCSKKELKLHLNRHNHSGKEFLCNICGKPFPAKRHLKNHTLNVHDVYAGTVPVFKCEVCQRPCRSQRILKEHMLTHSEASNLCTICGKSFRQQGGYRHHMQRHGEERPYKCQKCPAAFKVPELLNHHTRIKHDGRTYDCGHCGKKFVNAKQRTYHVKKEHFGLVYKCDICGKVSKNQETLRYHRLRMHDPNFKPIAKYECDICTKKFTAPSLLANHKKGVHGGEADKNFECKECGKKFTFKTRLKLHSVSHMKQDEKRFKCDQCGKKFAFLHQLKQHSISHITNEDEKRFQCNQCGKKFGLPHHLRQHEVTHGIGDYGVKWRRNRGSRKRNSKDPDESVSESEEEMSEEES